MGQDKLTLGEWIQREWGPVLSPGIISSELGRTLGECDVRTAKTTNRF